MVTRNRYVARSLILIAALALAHSTAYGGDDEFKKLVKQVEANYRAKRRSIPFLGVANFFVKIVQPKGVKGFKLAIFEDQDFSPRPGETEFGTVMRGALRSDWQPLVQSSARRGGDRTHVYAKYLGKDIKLLMVAFRPRQAFVVEVKLDPTTLVEWLRRPGGIGEALLNNNYGNFDEPVARGGDPDYSPPPSEPSPANAASAVTIEPPAKTKPTLGVRQKGDEAIEAAGENEAATAAETRAEPPDPAAVKLEARLVHLNVRAASSSGKVISDLKREDFTILEDGVRQEVSYFQPLTAPVNLVLLLDLSGSTKDKVEAMKKAAKKFVASLQPDDRVAVATFTSKFYLISNFTTDRKLLKDRIDKIKKTSSGTNYYDAMWATLNLLGEIKEARKAVVVLTDGVDNSILHPERYPDRHSFDELMARVSEEEATVYPIYFDTEYEVVVKRGDGNHEEYAAARKQLQEVADQTGGVLFKAARAEDLEGVYERVASELRTFYSVAYAPADTSRDGRWRRITVRVNRAEANARARRGYYAK
jgi:VWFA-related protein